MKRPFRIHPDGIVVAASAFTAALLGVGLSFLLSSHVPTLGGTLRGLFLASYTLSWTPALSTIAFVFAITVRRSTFPSFTSLYVGESLFTLVFLGLQTALPFIETRAETLYIAGSIVLFARLLLSTRLLTAILGKSDESSLLAGIGAIAAIIIFNNYNRVAFIGIEQALLVTWRDTSVLVLLHPVLFMLQLFLKSIQEPDSERSERERSVSSPQ